MLLKVRCFKFGLFAIVSTFIIIIIFATAHINNLNSNLNKYRILDRQDSNAVSHELVSVLNKTILNLKKESFEDATVIGAETQAWINRVSGHINNEIIKYYLTVVPKRSRLGNQMFMYAALLGIAIRNKRKPALENDLKMFKIFRNSLLKSFVDKETVSKLSFDILSEEGNMKYCVATEDLPHKNIKLQGSLQSYLYFQNYSNVIRNEFTFNDDILNRSKSVLQNCFLKNGISVENTITIAIHNRRGDMTKELYSNMGFTVATKEYFVNAMQYMRQKFEMKQILWVIGSDEISWCRQNIVKLDAERICFLAGTAELDLAVLSLCNHTIMSIGTFGWWAAWLAGGETVYYKNWPRNGSMLYSKFKASEFFPPNWIGIE